MRTTLIIADPVFERVHNEARRKKRRLSDLVTEAIEAYLVRLDSGKPRSSGLGRLKTFSMGSAAVDINNRDALERRMEM